MYNGHGNFFFYYDKKTRLIELYKDGPQFPIKHRYGYNSSNQIITDTLFSVVDITEDVQFIFAPRFISVLTYDFQGRIIKEVVTDLAGCCIGGPLVFRAFLSVMMRINIPFIGRQTKMLFSSFYR